MYAALFRQKLFFISRPGIAHIYNLHKIGNREIVGHGRTGGICYYDCTVWPMPSVRWREDSPEFDEVRRKEECDWKDLSVDEKKKLYRFSFCQTLAEYKAPSGEWKLMWAAVCFALGIGIYFQILQVKLVYDDLPSSMSFESQREQLKRLILIMHNPVHGLSSRWDYEKMTWK